MALIKCKECKNNIANDAKICPNCGTTTKYGKELKAKNKKNLLIITIVLLISTISIYAIVNVKKEKNKIVGKWVQEYEHKLGNITTKYIDTFIFNSDGTCVNENKSISNNSGESISSDPCSYKIKNNKITITWLNDEYWYDENKNEVKSLSMPFIQGDDYIVLDEDKYEKR